MPHLVYSEDVREPFTGRRIPYEDQPATKYYLRHLDNLLFLEAVSRAPRDFVEKCQAEREIRIAQRKMAHWQHHPNFNTREATAQTATRRLQWKNPPRR